MFSATCYQQLSEEVRQFRLLTIGGGGADAELQCILRCANVEDERTERWETVSYCWGNPQQRVPLKVNGHILLVPSNARDAIFRLRLPSGDRVVWIDSVCINQADVLERSRQVANMGLIYREAKGNLIFLGHPPGIDTHKIANVLRDGAERIRAARGLLTQAEETGYMTGLVPNNWLVNGVVILEEMEALDPLFRSPWFQRLWVVQEASLAKNNVCLFGASDFPLEDVLLNASINTRPISFGAESTRGIFAAAAIRQFAISSHQPIDLGGEHFLNYHPIIRTMDTTDPRDRVYAVLDIYRHRAGLKRLPELLVPDYTRAIAHVFRDATRHALTEPASGGLLSTICHRSDSDMNETGYTSWTKRFDRRFSPADDCLALRSAATTFKPDSVDHHLELADAGDLNILILKGWIIGNLTWSSVSASTSQFQSLNYDIAKDMVDSLLARSMTVASFQTYGMDDAYSLAADVLSTGSLGGQGFQFNDRTARENAFKLYTQHLHEERTIPDIPRTGTVESISSIATFYKLMSNQTHRRRCFQLDSGHVGIGPAMVREGDILAICNGAEHPYVLRPVGPEYRFVGAAYVPGLMTGQVFHFNLEPTWFSIR